MRRILTTGFIVIALSSLTFAFAACKDDPENHDEIFKYDVIYDDGSVIGYGITGLNDNMQPEEIVIPSVYNGKPVIEIRDEAFIGSEFTSAVIPDSIVLIGEKAFYDCNSIEKVTVGKGVTQIGGLAFAKCTNLESVYISDVVAWCEIAFAGMSSNPLYFAQKLYINNEIATEIVIPDSVKSINDYAFYGCGNITEVKTGNGVKSIGENAFYNCEVLESVTIGNGVEIIGESAFADCLELKALNLGNGVKSIGDYAFSQCRALSGNIVLSNVVTIGECAFTGCENLEKVVLCDGLKAIGGCAFGGCRKLSELIIPDSVISIGWGVIMFDVGAAGFDSAGDSTNNLTKLVLSNSITEIPDYAFSKSNILSLQIGRSVKKICYSAFYGCGLLQSVVIPVSVTNIESYAFYRCTALESVYYEGTAEEWDKIRIGKNGNDVSAAQKYFYSETEPGTEGNFWHYVDGAAVKW